jgi:hypothetical protein
VKMMLAERQAFELTMLAQLGPAVDFSHVLHSHTGHDRRYPK